MHLLWVKFLEGQQRLAVESLIEMAGNTEAVGTISRLNAEELLNDTDSVTLDWRQHLNC